MAKRDPKGPRRPDLREDPLVSHAGPRRNGVVLKGFLSKGPQPKKWRLYLNTELTEFFEFAEGAILDAEQQPIQESGVSGTTVWLSGSAEVAHIRTNPAEAWREFLHGELETSSLKELSGLGIIEAGISAAEGILPEAVARRRPRPGPIGSLIFCPTRGCPTVREDHVRESRVSYCLCSFSPCSMGGDCL
jgi:hypothetical protein